MTSYTKAVVTKRGSDDCRNVCLVTEVSVAYGTEISERTLQALCTDNSYFSQFFRSSWDKVRASASRNGPVPVAAQRSLG